jgi:hypothetical protein
MEFIETSIFTRQVMALLRDDEYRELQIVLSVHPVLEQLFRTAAD